MACIYIEGAINKPVLRGNFNVPLILQADPKYRMLFAIIAVSLVLLWKCFWCFSVFTIICTIVNFFVSFLTLINVS